MSAQLAVDFVEEITPQEKLDILRGTFMQFESRDRGSGRPTKRDRRLIDKLTELYNFRFHDFRFSIPAAQGPRF